MRRGALRLGLAALAAAGCAGGAPELAPPLAEPPPLENLTPLDSQRFDRVWVDPANPGESWRVVTLRVGEIRLAWNLAADRSTIQVNRKRQAQALFDAWSKLLRAVFAEPGCVQVVAEPRAKSLEIVLALRDVELAPAAPSRGGFAAGFSSGGRAHLVAEVYDAESRSHVARIEERRVLAPRFAVRSGGDRLLQGLFELSQDLRAELEALCIPRSGAAPGGEASR